MRTRTRWGQEHDEDKIRVKTWWGQEHDEDKIRVKTRWEQDKSEDKIRRLIINSTNTINIYWCILIMSY